MSRRTLSPSLTLLLCGLPVAAHAEADRGTAPAVVAAPDTAGVIGGTDVPPGRWPDTAAILFDGQQGCTGTLIAPTVVLTAGHCVDSSLDGVWVGTHSLSASGTGETIPVTARHEYPNSWNTFDVAVLTLAQPSTIAPRALATGWARLDIVDGARVQLVGYGAIDRNADRYIAAMQEAETTLTDADCSSMSGCNAGARPAGELGAGGMGIDTCPGDSGGPLYLKTPYGDFLAGVTSRGYTNNDFYCSEGGIYERPDAIVDWIEDMAGVPVARGPEPVAPAIVAVSGGGAETSIEVNDPIGVAHTFEIATAPTRGEAVVNAAGRVRVCTEPGFVGDDTVGVRITDAADPARSLEVTIAIAAEAGEADGACSLEFEDEGGGCCGAGRRSPTGMLALIGLVGLALTRRRRR